MIQKNKRRKILQSTSLGFGIIGLSEPSIWVRPIVESISLPSHALTTVADETQVTAFLEGVVDGEINTQFVADASASSSTNGGSLMFEFSVSGPCSLDSQDGSMATISRGLISGTCTVTVVVSDGELTDSVSDSAEVTGGPPDPPNDLML